MRYVIQFSKQGSMRYISHLDLLRLFKRSFKRMGMSLEHSQGFNPHPKMSFVQPLSLGFTSRSEYLEVETMDEFECERIVSLLNEAMPQGITVLFCRQLPKTKRTLAATVEFGSYHIRMPLSQDHEWKERLVDFLAQDEITVMKKQKKTKKLVEQNIRPMILSMEEYKDKVNSVDGKMISLITTVRAGSNCNLNPEVLLRAFCEFAGISFEKEAVRIEREDLYCKDEKSGELVPIKDLSLQRME